jgi:hypothetical protein
MTAPVLFDRFFWFPVILPVVLRGIAWKDQLRISRATEDA